MKIAIGSDHRGFDAKQRIRLMLQQAGHEVVDFGTHSKDSVDYPDFAFPVAQAVAGGGCERGVLVDCTGLGVCIVANKVPGIRAALCHDRITTEMSRRHNDANVLCLSGELLGADLTEHLVRLWLETPFDGGRHARRVEKITRFEEGEGRTP
jgi:ribose 5-phosphate isomerase B